MIFNTVILPFDINYLAENFGLNRSYVRQENFDLMGGVHYEITFDNLEHAQTFYEVIKTTDCCPHLWSHKNSIQIPCTEGWRILKVAGTPNHEIAPFSLDFFASYFGLEKQQVAKTTTSSFCYEIYFHDEKISRDFFKHLEASGLYPKWGWGTNCVSINNIQIIMLLKAAAKLSPQKPVVLFKLAVDNVPASLPASLLVKPSASINVNTTAASISSTAILPGSEINPFNVDWLSKHFGLNSADIISAKFDVLGMYEIKFKNLVAAEQFCETMTTAQCFPKLWTFNTTVELNKHNKDKIIQAAALPHRPESQPKLKMQVASVPSSFFPSAARQSDEDAADAYRFPNIRVVVKHTTLACDAKNDQDFIKHWIHAFKLTSGSAISLYKANEENSGYGASTIGVQSDYFTEREVVQFFSGRLREISNINRLDALFSHVAAWEAFYLALPGIKQEDVIKFMSFVHKVKANSDRYGDIFILAKANLHCQGNPYLTIAALNAKTDSSHLVATSDCTM